jgi:hypothetical protein
LKQQQTEARRQKALNDQTELRELINETKSTIEARKSNTYDWLLSPKETSRREKNAYY